MASDPTVSHLLQLEPSTQRAAYFLIRAIREAGVPAIITSSRRSLQEQRGHVAAGRSTTLSSRHLTGQAFDIDIHGMNRGAVPKWFWDAVGPFGESLGLRWGGRWTFYDPGHFERSSTFL